MKDSELPHVYQTGPLGGLSGGVEELQYLHRKTLPLMNTDDGFEKRISRE
jgi:hypothetical protein